jgi:hypothetical protein
MRLYLPAYGQPSEAIETDPAHVPRTNLPMAVICEQ